MNPYLIIAALVAVMSAGWGGFRLGVDHQVASEIDKRQVVAEAVDAANSAAAAAISKIVVRNSTIRQEVEREIRTNTVYADCRHSDAGLRGVNAALTGAQTVTPGGGQLPGPDAPVGADLRRDDSKAGGGGGAVLPVPGGSAAGPAVTGRGSLVDHSGGPTNNLK